MSRETVVAQATPVRFMSAAERDAALAKLPTRRMELLRMLRYKRPARSKSEEEFITRFIEPLGVERDTHGNLWKTIGDAPILWSSHTDTVHDDEGIQRVIYGEAANAAWSDGENCLGADCTIGVWLMANMIRANVPGIYIFHRDEEVGGRGSRFIANKLFSRIEHLQFAIAFDRKGYDEIITHQMGSRCASDAFAASLAGVLSPMLYKASDGGTFTDTANYEHIIAECCNLGVGYFNQHTKDEWQDISHAEKLLDQILTAPWDRLVCRRDPTVIEKEERGYGCYGWASALERYVEENPDLVAEWLESYGVTPEQIERETGAYVDAGVTGNDGSLDLDRALARLETTRH